MIKKILCILISLFLLCAVISLPAMAAEYRSFDITELDIPMDGATPDFTAAISQSGCKVVSVEWMDLWTDQWMDADDQFKQETDSDGNVHSYRVVITIELTNGNKAGLDPWAVTVNGSNMSNADYEFTYYCINNECTLIAIEGDFVPTVHICSGGSATCVTAATCSICGNAYGNINTDNHNTGSSKKADTDEKHTTHHDVKCNLCGKIVSEEEHSWGALANNVQPCNICGYGKIVESPHTCSGGKATCKSKAICSTCGKEYGDVDANAHQYPDTYVSVDEEGHAKNCTLCGKRSDIEAHVPSEENSGVCKLCNGSIPQVTVPQETTPQESTPQENTNTVPNNNQPTLQKPTPNKTKEIIIITILAIANIGVGAAVIVISKRGRRVKKPSPGKTTLDEVGKTTLDTAGKTTLDTAGKTTLDEVSKTTLDEVGKTTLDTAGKTTLDTAGKTTLDEVGKTTLDEVGKTTLDTAGKTTLDTAGKTTLDTAGKTTLDTAGKTTLDTAGKTTLDTAGKTTLDEVGKTTLRPGKTTLDEVGKTTLDTAGKTTLDEVGKTTLDTAGKTTLDEVGKTTLDTAGKTTLDEVGKTTLDTAGKTTLDTAGKTTLDEVGKTTLRPAKTTLDEVGKTTLDTAGKTTLDTAGKTTLDTAGKTTLDTAGKTTLDTAGKTTLKPGKTTLDEVGKTTLDPSSKTTL